MVVNNKKGQSILEVLILIPFLFAFVGVLYKITMATQMAIVNTQYARSQVYVLTANSPEYPRLQFRLNPTMFAFNRQDRMVLGVADPEALSTSTGLEGTLVPIPQTQKISRGDASSVGSTDRGEVSKRTDIRVRNTSGICTQLNAVGNQKPMNSDFILTMGSQRWPFKQKVCQYEGMI